MNDNYQHCEVCRTRQPREWRLIEKPYYNGTRRSVLCPACHTAYRAAMQARGWAILPGVLAASRMNAGGPTTEDVIMKNKNAAQ